MKLKAAVAVTVACCLWLGYNTLFAAPVCTISGCLPREPSFYPLIQALAELTAWARPSSP